MYNLYKQHFSLFIIHTINKIRSRDTRLVSRIRSITVSVQASVVGGLRLERSARGTIKDKKL